MTARRRRRRHEGPDERIVVLAAATTCVPAQSLNVQLEQQASQQYRQLLDQAHAKGALATDGNADLQRLRRIQQRILPFTYAVNPRAQQWQWEVNLLGSTQVNKFCMPGGKIAFYSAIITKLKLSDDEIAIVMGHEITHVLKEHGVEQTRNQFCGELAARARSTPHSPRRPATRSCNSIRRRSPLSPGTTARPARDRSTRHLLRRVRHRPARQQRRSGVSRGGGVVVISFEIDAPGARFPLPLGKELPHPARRIPVDPAKQTFTSRGCGG